ncbi:hypothetical protein RHGRI_019438 [Rhododendron griersonianum]|uniref:DUF4220 domain-containing protein n=1 Tax=Rhododendron griersonianum TaxID=479676 RepID=A0AAV6JGF8_9ERIC|nr:hypothetical protein RHGRI_019438 [Rhododendron griersonianum]
MCREERTMPCYRTCKGDKQEQHAGEVMSKYWEIWDLRILALYILVSQLYLHFFGRRRTKSKSAAIMIGSISLLYLLSDLLATTALGKLSKLAVNKKFPTNTTDISTMTTINTIKKTMGNATIGKEMLRVMWAPLILFYLGGPDTITVLNLQENQMWMKHLIGLFTQGFRTVYALIATWSFSRDKPWSIQGLISLLALFILIPGIIKYGERVWIIKSKNKHDGGFIQLHPNRVRVKDSRPNAKRVLLAYFCIQALVPHRQDYVCNKGRVRYVTTNFLKSARKDSYEAFKLMEIELGLIYDMLFSKVGTIFTIWGSILRFLSLSLIVSGLVVFLKSDRQPGLFWEGDDVITIILIAGAIFLEIAGIVVQLFSDWAVVWACSDRIKWATPLLFLHEVLFFKAQRWPEVMGQLSLLDFFTKYNPNACTRCLKTCLKTCLIKVKCLGAWEYVFGMDKELKGYKTQKVLVPNVKDVIISYLCEKYDPSQSEKVADDGMLPEVTRGEWTIKRYGLEQQLEGLQFDKKIVIWHIATEVFYRLDDGRDTTYRKAVKMLSNYMMYLLVECSTKFPFCNKYDKIEKDYGRLMELFIREELVPSGQVHHPLCCGCICLSNEGDTTPYIADEAHQLVLHMKTHARQKRWDILASIWAEMLCYAAWRCQVKYHIEELRHGGEFLTRVWLLQMHCDRTLRRSSSSLRSDLDNLARQTGGSCFSWSDPGTNSA